MRDVISTVFQGIFVIRIDCLRIDSFDELSKILFEINFGSYCSYDGG